MKRFLLSALFIGFGLFAACNLADAQTTTFHGRDEFAQTGFEITGGEVGISVFRGPDGAGGTHTFLDYDSFVENPDGSATFTFGVGLIPSEAFDAHTLQHYTLNVDTSQVSGFRAETCTFANFTETCTQGSPLGVIQVSWQQNGVSSSSKIRHLSFTSGAFTRRLDDDEDESSADAAGTYLGTSFTDLGRASMGKARDLSVSITRNN